MRRERRLLRPALPVLRYADDVFRHVEALIGDGLEAEEVTQTLFAALPDSIGRYRQDRVRFSVWLLGVAREAALGHVEDDCVPALAAAGSGER